MRPVVGWLALVTSLAACSGLKAADPGASAPGDDGGVTTDPPPPPGGGSDAATTDSGADAGPPSFGTYDEAQSALEKKRFPGPTTAQGSTGFCGASTFIWRDSDGTLHGWSGKTQARIDYTFKAARQLIGVSDGFLPVDITPGYQNVAVYRTDAAGTQADTIPYVFNFLGTSDGVLQLDQKIGNVVLNGTKVRSYVVATKTIDDVSQVLPTVQRPSGWASGKVVIPGSTTIPFPLYVVDVAAKSTAQVTFDGSIGMRFTHPASFGLLVSYARTGPTSALRLYKNDQDVAGSRVEIGDEVKNLPGLFPDSPTGEHDVLAHVTSHGSAVIYDSAFGIFAFDAVKGTLVPLQLGAQKKAFVVDTLCVLEAEGLLLYRNAPDPVGQVWALPLAGLLP